MRYGGYADHTTNRRVIDDVLEDALLEDEEPQFATSVDRAEGSIGWLVVTDQRILTFSWTGTPVDVLRGSAIEGIDFRPNGKKPKLWIRSTFGESWYAGTITSPADQGDLLEALADVQESSALKRAPFAARAVAVHAGTGGGTNTIAVLAFVFGVLGGILGVIFGHVALSQIRRTGQDGRGLAIAGLVLGYTNLVVWAVLLFALR